ncbi:MAG: nuclear transport factor 2 family protein [Phycisphaerae bacterium]|nr:nuclear transport factor 2 family protein [Phycisphaerae bacterium]
MRTTPSFAGGATLLIATALCAIGADCNSRSPQKASIDRNQVEGEVRALLDRWVRAFESRDEIAIRAVLVDGDRFVWLEDGEARYPSADAVVAALKSFPPGLRFSHKLTSVRVVPLSDDAAWAQLGTATEIRQGERAVSQFSSVVLMLVERVAGAWRIAAGHTSSGNGPRPGPPQGEMKGDPRTP